MLRIVVGAREVPAYSTNENTFILKASNLVRRDSLNLACQVVEKTKGKKTHTHTHTKKIGGLRLEPRYRSLGLCAPWYLRSLSGLSQMESCL